MIKKYEHYSKNPQLYFYHFDSRPFEELINQSGSLSLFLLLKTRAYNFSNGMNFKNYKTEGKKSKATLTNDNNNNNKIKRYVNESFTSQLKPFCHIDLEFWIKFSGI